MGERALTTYVNGERRDTRPGTTLRALVAELVPAGEEERPRGVAVAVNGGVVPGDSWATTILDDGDRIEVVNAVQGG